MTHRIYRLLHAYMLDAAAAAVAACRRLTNSCYSSHVDHATMWGDNPPPDKRQRSGAAGAASGGGWGAAASTASQQPAAPTTAVGWGATAAATVSAPASTAAVGWGSSGGNQNEKSSAQGGGWGSQQQNSGTTVATAKSKRVPPQQQPAPGAGWGSASGGAAHSTRGGEAQRESGGALPLPQRSASNGPSAGGGSLAGRLFESVCRAPAVEDPSRAAELPIVAHRSEILSLLEKNQVMIVTGETGSGKTTQVPQFILSRWPEANMIVTQPRRIAATSIAKRVAGEMRAGAVGGLVGYQIGMKSELSASTRLLFCTTGILLRRLVTNKEKSAAEFT